jgi:hypothetical protein
MTSQQDGKRIIFSYNGDSDKPIPTIILSTTEYKPINLHYYEFYQINEKLFYELLKPFEGTKESTKSSSRKDSLYDVQIFGNGQPFYYSCHNMDDIHVLLSKVIVCLNQGPKSQTSDAVIKSFEKVDKRLYR